MRRVSKKQSRKNTELQKIKSKMEKRCFFCGFPANQLMHILNRSTFPQYHTAEWNLIIGCNFHHAAFDYDIEFRKKYDSLYTQVVKKVNPEDIGRVNKYFGKI